MALDNIGLVAQQKYSHIQNQPRLNAPKTQISEASNFHNMVNKQFNKFAHMSPTQILSHVKAAQVASNMTSMHAVSASSTGTASGLVGSATRNMRSSIKKHEQTSRDSLIDQASIGELLSSTIESRNLMDTMVKFRDKFLDAYEKIINMSM